MRWGLLFSCLTMCLGACDARDDGYHRASAGEHAEAEQPEAGAARSEAPGQSDARALKQQISVLESQVDELETGRR